MKTEIFTYRNPDIILVQGTWQECEDARVWHQYAKFSVQSETADALAEHFEKLGYDISFRCPAPDTVKTFDNKTGFTVCEHKSADATIKNISAWITDDMKKPLAKYL